MNPVLHSFGVCFVLLTVFGGGYFQEWFFLNSLGLVVDVALELDYPPPPSRLPAVICSFDLCGCWFISTCCGELCCLRFLSSGYCLSLGGQCISCISTHTPLPPTHIHHASCFRWRASHLPLKCWWWVMSVTVGLTSPGLFFHSTRVMGDWFATTDYIVLWWMKRSSENNNKQPICGKPQPNGGCWGVGRPAPT